MTSHLGEPRAAQAKEIFLDLLDLPPEQRTAELERRAGADADLRDQIRSLLEAEGRAAGFMDAATVHDPQVDGSSRDLARLPRRNIGPYRLLQEIGEGGFGVVYMAEQERPVRRRVALKVIRVGMDSRQVIARFDAERQALAMMDHPSIARVFDAGTSDDGRPYFVMELVKGTPITEYCDRNKLPVRSRLELFAQVCHAVQHAHQKGLIHRDIKPSNILVSTQDDRPLAKIIDFGVAKATQARLTDKTLFTEYHQLVGTPEYMSPEQAEGSLDIDTRSDIYSLGVLLYELLTGTTPFDARELRSKAYAEMQRVIREVDPPRPSTRLSTLVGETRSEVAQRRSVEPRRLSTLVQGELDWIVMMCLEKDRARRYESATSLAADVLRFLSDQPVSAGPPGQLYRIRKFARRHTFGMSMAAAMALVLVSGLLVASWGLLRATRERNTAVAARAAEADARELAEEANAFLRGMFQSIDPEEARGRPVLVRDVLDVAARRADGAFAQRPAVEAAVRETFATAYLQLGLFEQARQQFARGIEVLESSGRPRDAQRLPIYTGLGTTLRELGRYEESEEALRRSLTLHEQVLGKEHEATVHAANELGDTLLGRNRIAEAERIALEQYEHVRRTRGPDDRVTFTAAATLGVVRHHQGRLGEAEQLHRQSLEAARRVLGADHPEVIVILHHLGSVLRDQGKFDDAYALERQALELASRVYGPNHPRTLRASITAALLLSTTGKAADAQAMLEETIARLRRELGDDHPTTLYARNNRAQILELTHRIDEAEAEYRDIAQRRERVLGRDHPDTLMTHNQVCNILMARGRDAEAEAIYRDLLPRLSAAVGAQHPWTLSTKLQLGRALYAQKNWTDAEPLLADAYTASKSTGAPSGDWSFASSYGYCLSQVGKPREAIVPLLEAESAMRAYPKLPSRSLRRVTETLIQCFDKIGEHARAEEYRSKLSALPEPAPPPASHPATRPAAAAAG